MKLSPRQRRLMDLIAGGLSVKEAAQRLTISEGTARSYMRVIYLRLNARGIAHAIAIWVK